MRTVTITPSEAGSVEGGGTYDLGAQATLTAIPHEGYRFVVWSDGNTDNPRIMIVDRNISLSAVFAPKDYTLRYVVDGVEYKSYTIGYGTSITPEPAPVKEGYTFSGWSDLPATMPAHDVTVKGSFSVNIHKVTWMIDGALIAETDVKYGETIVQPKAPEKEGYEFVGWENVPKSMPDYDLVIYGKYTPVSGVVYYLGDKKQVDVYTIQGFLVGKNMGAAEIMSLPRGTYIINGKVIVKNK